jgi:signal-transduction protein with cAMP-binding, CBS, and nucleotidyltransferase domain
MTKDVVTIRGLATVAAATKLMREKGARALIVDRRHDRDAYGIITATDIVYKVAALGKDPRAIRVYQIMTKPCITINPDLGVEYVARLFAENGLRLAPVIQQTLLGIVSESDILNKGDFLEHAQQAVLGQDLAAAIASARAICGQAGASSPACLDAWQVVDAIQSEVAFQGSEIVGKTAFEEFCEEYPEALDAKMYDAWCSG